MPMTPEESYQQAVAEFEQPAETPPEPTVEAATATPEQPAEAAAEPEQPTGPQNNPSWDEAWENVPDPIREQQRAVFQKWDANFNKVQAQYRPYEEFERQGYNPEYLQTAVEIQRALIEDPQGFVQKVVERFGLSSPQAQGAIAAAQQQEEEVFQTPEEQRLAALEAQQQQILQNFQQRQQAEQAMQEQQRYVTKITDELANLHTQFGDFDEERVVRWAAQNAQSGGNPDLSVALHEMRAYEAEIVRQHTRQAPQVLGSSNAIAPPASAPEPPKGPLSNDELLQRALAMGPQLLGNG